MDEREFVKIASKYEKSHGMERATEFASIPCPDDSEPRPTKSFGSGGAAGVRSLILVLESPHTEEFHGAGAPRAANGSTGRAIDEWLSTVLKTSRIDLQAKVGVYVMNAVQFQCSLGQSGGKARDFIFRTCWERPDVVEDFAHRLRKMVKQSRGKPAFVINACTSGPRRTRREKVDRAIHEALKNQSFDYDCLEHPSNWGRRKYEKDLAFPEWKRYRWKV